MYPHSIDSLVLFVQATASGWLVWSWIQYAAWAGLVPPYAFLRAAFRHPQEDKDSRQINRVRWTALGLLFLTWGPGSYLWLPPLWEWMIRTPAPWPMVIRWQLGDFPYLAWGGGGAISVFIWITLHRWLPAGLERLRIHFRKGTVAAREGKTDIRTVSQHLPSPTKPYNPAKYFRPGSLFFGLDERGKPVSVPYPELGKHPHTVVGGTTGCGKGVFIGLYMSQALRHGEAVFAIDPKDDEWAPHLLRQECAKQGIPFHLVDLREDRPQVNILAGASPRQVEELLVAGLSLSDQGGDADHYRVTDRRAAGSLVRGVLAANPAATLADLAEAAEASLQDAAPGLAGRLCEAAEGCALSATGGGADLVKIAAEGGAIYIIGGSEGRLTVMQRMFLVRLQQIAADRDRTKGPHRQIMLFLDEVKDLLSKPALDALAKIRDKGMHVVLAHQSLGDFENVPGLKPSAVKAAIIENCRWSVQHGVGDSVTAQWLADNSGQILVDDESRQVETAAALVERQTGNRTLRQTERPRIDVNMWLALRDLPGVAVAAVGGQRRFIHVCPLAVEKQPLALAVGTSRAPAISAQAKPAQPSLSVGGLPDDDF